MVFKIYILGFGIAVHYAVVLKIIIFSCNIVLEFEADFKFVVLIGSFKSLCTPHLKYYSNKITIPSLHVIGEGDDIITKGKCLFFKNNVIKFIIV